jgi:hypothetical protein
MIVNGGGRVAFVLRVTRERPIESIYMEVVEIPFDRSLRR